VREIIIIIMVSILVSGCTGVEIPLDVPFEMPSIPYLDEIVKRLPKIPFLSGEEEKVNETKNEVKDFKAVFEKKNKSVKVDETEEKYAPFSEIRINPIFAQQNLTSKNWDVVFEVELKTNIPEEYGEWFLSLESGDKILKRFRLYTSQKGDFEYLNAKFSIDEAKEGSKVKLVAIREVRILQDGGGTAVSYEVRKEKEISLSSSVKFYNTTFSCPNLIMPVSFSGIVPAKISLEISMPEDNKNFVKVFRITGNESYYVDFDKTPRKSIFDVKNGNSTITLNLEKYVRIATPNSSAKVILSGGGAKKEISFAKPNISVERIGNNIILKNSKNSFPIYIDSISDNRGNKVVVGRILCDEMEVYFPHSGRIMVVGGANLYWDEYKERYLTKMPEYIVFTGNI
jgi:hypothetical protein